MVLAKPTHTVAQAYQAADRIVVKFSEGSGVHLRSGRLAAPAVDLTDLVAQLQAVGSSAGAMRRLFARDDAALETERAEGQRRSGRALADLSLYYEVAVPVGTDIGALCDRLNSLPYVELALPAPKPAPPPVDLAPPTADFTASQGYEQAAPSGIGKLDPTLVPGGDGSGITIVDIEYQWVLDHEDLELPPSANIDTATLFDPFAFDEGNHGTAVLGELGARENGYGVAGIVPGATLKVAPVDTVEFGYDIGRAVSLATAVLGPGDVILIEQQTCVCSLPCDSNQFGLGPVEWFQPWYDAIATATAMGIVVVEAAGNGSVNLDQPACVGAFDRSLRDSGAIIVGAADPDFRAWLGFSCYGSRVDLQGWGVSVVTSGYGDLFDPGDLRQRYTAFFSGTSSASPIVTGASAALQGVRTAAGFPPYTPAELRQLLRATGTPQFVEPNRIGPRPNLGAAAPLAAACGNNVTDPDEACDDGNLISGDGCDLNCTVTACGNGIVTAGESCDDGNVVGGDDCSPTCTNGCGNGSREVSEPCDGSDPGSCPTGACDPDCTCPDPVCGNDLIEEGENCDGISDAACPGSCGAPGGPSACRCPSFDQCLAATVIGGFPFVDFQDTSAATVDGDDPFLPCGASGQQAHSVWYTFVAPVDGTVFANTLDSSYDTVLAALSGVCGSLNVVAGACNDDSGSGASQISFPVTGGTIYFLEVTSFANNPGGFLILSASFDASSGGARTASDLACQTAIGGAARNFLTAKHKAIVECNNAAIGGRSCNAGRRDKQVLKAADKMVRSIVAACRRIELRDLGFPGSCFDPTFGDFVVGDLTECIEETHAAIVDLVLIPVEYPGLGGLAGDELRCQRTVGRAARSFVTRKLRARAQCLDGQLRGKIPASVGCRAEVPPFGGGTGDAKTDGRLIAAGNDLFTRLLDSCAGVTLEHLGFPGFCFDENAGAFDVTDLRKCVLVSHESLADQLVDIQYPPSLPNPSPIPTAALGAGQIWKLR
jgi:cysteine-rich repeat protein